LFFFSIGDELLAGIPQKSVKMEKFWDFSEFYMAFFDLFFLSANACGLHWQGEMRKEIEMQILG